MHRLAAMERGKDVTRCTRKTIQGFFEAFNRADLDALIARYEPTATMVPQPGQMAEGHTAIREALNRFLATKPSLTLEKKSLVMAGISHSLSFKRPSTGPALTELRSTWSTGARMYCADNWMAAGSS
jgi:SnoaL-like domain